MIKKTQARNKFLGILLNSVNWKCDNLFMTIQTAIDVEGLTKRVSDADGDLTILDDIRFCVQMGESLAITGASGSGKSTLLGLMAGLDVPSAGTVRVLDTDIFSLNEDGRAKFRATHIGFVFQSFQLLPNLTALENVMLPLELAGRDAYAPAVEVLAEVGLEHRLHHYPSTLSGGEQQRVSIARAFISRPALLLADEPTGSLDVVTGARIIDLMFRMHREHNTTLVLVTHDQNLAHRCQRVIEIHAGQLVADK
jgi:putative ABC transport system ATP-binding protein